MMLSEVSPLALVVPRMCFKKVPTLCRPIWMDARPGSVGKISKGRTIILRRMYRTQLHRKGMSHQTA